MLSMKDRTMEEKQRHLNDGRRVASIGCLHPLGDLEAEFNTNLQPLIAPRNTSYEHLRIQPARTVIQYVRLVAIAGPSGRI
jgi:hypothetical protein